LTFIYLQIKLLLIKYIFIIILLISNKCLDVQILIKLHIMGGYFSLCKSKQLKKNQNHLRSKIANDLANEFSYLQSPQKYFDAPLNKEILFTEKTLDLEVCSEKTLDLEVFTNTCDSLGVGNSLNNDKGKNAEVSIQVNCQIENTEKKNSDSELMEKENELDKNLISCSFDKSVINWKKSNRYSFNLSSEIFSVIRLNSENIACCTLDNSITIWNETSASIVSTLFGHSNVVNALLMFDKDILISGGNDDLIKVWNWKEKSMLFELDKHNDCINCLVKLSDSIFASGGQDNEINIWNIYEGLCVRTLQDNGPVNCILQYFSQKDNLPLLLSGGDQKIKLWNWKTGICIKTIHAHESKIYSMIIINTNQLVSSGKDKLIKIWDLNNYNCLKTFKGHTRGVSCLIKLNDEEFASGSGDCTIKIWNHVNNICRTTLNGHTDAVLSLCI